MSISAGVSRLCAGLTILLLAVAPAFAEEAKAKPETTEKATPPSPWYFFLGNINNQPRMKAADRMTDNMLNKPFQAVAPGLEDVRTFSDQRDEFMIWTPYVGVGRKLSPHWDLFYQMGFSKGHVRSNQTEPSLLLLPVHLDVTIYRSSFFTGFGLAYYPWRLPELRAYASWAQRFKHAKPFIVTTLNYNYLTYEAKVKAGLRPLDNLIHTTQKDEWSPFSSGVAIGLDIPLTEDSALCLNTQYNMFWDQGSDFSGLGFNIYWKKSF